MATVTEHYENLLAEHYSWMFGDFDARVDANRQFFASHQIFPRKSAIAVDLGAGPGNLHREHGEGGNSVMKRLKKILCWTTGSVLLLVFVVFALVFWSMRPTMGPRIGKYPAPRTALLIIDIQEDYTGPHARKRYGDGDRIVGVSNALLAQARAKGAVVVYIENLMDNPIMSALTGGLNAPGSPGTEMDRRLIKVPGAVTFTKNRSDAFSTPELDAYLRENHVDHLLITGLDGAYCVDATARGALNRGYKVTLFQDGVATESSKSIEKLAQSWREAGARVTAGTEM